MDQIFVGPITKVLFFNCHDLLVCGSGPLLRIFNTRKGTLECIKAIPVERIHGIKSIGCKDDKLRIVVWGKNKVFLFLVQNEEGKISLLSIANFTDMDDWVYCILQLEPSNHYLTCQKEQIFHSNLKTDSGPNGKANFALANEKNVRLNDIILVVGQAHNRIQIWRISQENDDQKGKTSMIAQFISQNQSLLR